MASENRWAVQPLQALEGDVPVPYRIVAANPHQTAVTVGCGRTVTIAPDGLVRNASGTPIFRLEPLPRGAVADDHPSQQADRSTDA